MKNLLTIILTIISLQLTAQTTISGIVEDDNGETIIGANISIENTYDGTSSDVDGKFEFVSTETGSAKLVVSYLGYENLEIELELNNEAIQINPVLESSVSELEMVVITAGSFEASDEKKAVVLKSVDIAMTAGATADIAGALNTLPGTQKVGEDGQLYVRGGAASETRTFIDGMFVQNPYNSTVPDVPSRGRFSPFLFKGTMFSTGGYSAEYGQALSSALILNSQDLAPKTTTGVSLMTVGGELSHTHRWENTSLSVSGNYTNLKPYTSLVKQNIDWIKAPQGFGGQAIFRHKTSETGIIKVLSSASRNQIALQYPNEENVNKLIALNLQNDNVYINASYKEILNDKWSLFTGVAHTNNTDLINSDFAVNTKEHSTQGKATFTNTVNDKVTLKFGGEYLYNDFNEKYVAADGEDFKTDLGEHYAGAFAESDIYLSNKLVVRAGARLERSTLLDDWNIAPRLSVAYKTGEKSQVSMAYGQFYQNPENELLRFNTDINFERADHLIANYQIIKDKRTFRVEAYSKLYNNLVKYDANTPWLSTNDGSGYARGIDVFFRDKKTIKNGDYWISYSYLDTERDYLDFPEAARPHFASAHNASLVYKHWLGKLDMTIGATYSFGSGRPYNNPNLDTFNSERTKPYQDLSLNAAYLTRIAGNFTILYVSASNIPGFEQNFGFRYSNTPNDNGLFTASPIEPPAKRFFFIGLFMNFE